MPLIQVHRLHITLEEGRLIVELLLLVGIEHLGFTLLGGFPVHYSGDLGLYVVELVFETGDGALLSFGVVVGALGVASVAVVIGNTFGGGAHL